MSETNPKQQIADKIKDSTNILVTVSNNPSTDELSAALGLSLLLNKLKKHATAVFSGEIPQAINFMEPAKTFENTVDSLRDFIIALDKEKADHLRYKVEGDVVKIFVTPYRTTITSDDLDFSQGDYNVELVLALGVKHQESLDKALEAHGQILDDATVATIVAGSESSDLGNIGWQDKNASCLSEMIVNLSQTMKVDKGFIDEQIATAFLSGLVAATERFSNSHTSAKVMTMAADLMSAGANQQLIASQFEEAEEGGGEASVSEPVLSDLEASVAPEKSTSSQEPDAQQNYDGTTNLAEGESTKLDRDDKTPEEDAKPEEAPGEAKNDAGTLNISHEKEGTLEEVAEQTATEGQAEATKAAEAAASAAQPAQAAEQELSDALPPVVAPADGGAPADISPADLQKDIEAANEAVEKAAEAPQLQGAVSSDVWKNSSEPTYGGTLNATTEAAAEASRKLEEADRNRTILNHGGGYIAEQMPTYDSPINAASQPPEQEEMVDPLSDGPASPTLMAPPVQPPASVSAPTLTEIDDQNRAVNPTGLPPLPDFSTLPPLPPAPPPPPGAPDGNAPAEKLGDILPPAEPVPQAAPVAPDPGQFKIPGQS